MSAARYRLGFALVTASAIAWSTAGLFTRALPLDSATLLAWRGIYGGIGIVAIGLMVEGRQIGGGFRRFCRRDGWPGWLFAASAIIGMICYIASLRATSVAHVAVIYASIPFVAAAFGWIFVKERPTFAALSASLAALLGIAVMVGFGSDGALAGDLLAFGMTLGMASGMVLARRFHDIPFLPAAAISAFVSGAICWPYGHPLDVTAGQMGLLALFGIVNSAVGFGLFTLGARFLPTVETALIGSLDAPLSPLWVWLVFNEVPGVSTLVGGAIVFVAVAVFLAISGRQSMRPAQTAIAETA